jgi:hypothetical protein
MPIIIANFLNMGLLILVVIKFLHELNKRFGNSYKRAKYTVTVYMLLFSLSFMLRGTTDIMQKNQNLLPILMTAWYQTFFYLLTEWLPLFVLYCIHITQFRP